MNAAADRNLLFGMIAYQLNFVGKDALVDAVRHWLIDKKRSLGEILVERRQLPGDLLAMLDQLVNRHVVEAGGGDAARSLAQLSSVDTPIVRELRALGDPDLECSVALLPAPKSTIPDGTALNDGILKRLPDLRFDILRPHAEGGLGKVSVAMDSECHREVAFKEIKEPYAGIQESRTRANGSHRSSVVRR